ncbi:hypothetical protein [Streptomyces sp. ITFR-16]|uniref:hypothetical protein n=1 Tax=Streptomyces sp. ITFR-16 TaxID=3075198 RepID=UPI00288BF15A|nr:hypothetical protein [Streptomyces sp. ITFR-16]WNI23757.1 hypothetical protein RLT58_18340 [Streptomyces sp. ITFR-16]
MASGHLSSWPSRSVACLALTAAAVLGAMTGGETHADGRAVAGSPPSASVDPSASAGPSSSASPSASPSPGARSPRPEELQTPMAGLPAGAGRERPGRSVTPSELAREDAVAAREERPQAAETAADAASPAPSLASDAERMSRQALDGADLERVRQMSLGSGIALVGLGLGFLAFRMRRTG